MSGAAENPPQLEQQRLQLEANIQKLQSALQHWQTWDTEYEALKEEFDAVNEAGDAELARIKKEFEGEVISEREIDDIFYNKGPRSKAQITNLLDHRIQYVTKNIESLQSQIEKAENEYAGAIAASELDAPEDEGAPITEIIEQLDDDDQVVSYRLNKPSDSLSLVQEAMEKAGLDVANAQEEGAKEQAQPSQPSPSRLGRKQPMVEPKKEISQVEEHDVDVADAAPVAEIKPKDSSTEPMSQTAKRVGSIMNTAQAQEAIVDGEAIIPEDEDPYYAELRREALQYNLAEVGAVVAELEVDEGDYDDTDGEFNFSDEGFDEDDEDGEDKYGRSTGQIVTDKYRERMLELEKKLGIKSRFTSQAAAATDDGDSGSDDERIGRIVVKPSAETAPSASKAAPSKSIIKDKQSAPESGKKGVRFASSLDIAPANESTNQPAKSQPAKDAEPVIEPLGDVVERSGPIKSVDAKSTRRPSRFKKATAQANTSNGIPPGPFDVPAKLVEREQQQPVVVPTGPEGKTIADDLVERESTAAPAATDEIEDVVTYSEVADEHQRLRRKFIQREGGFLKEDESPIQPLDEADGGPARLSRFKAARLSKQ